MALTPTEEAQTRDLIAQQSALLSLAGVEATILSKLGATKVTLSDLPSASVVNDADLLLLRQGTTDKSIAGSVIKALIPEATFTQSGTGATSRTYQNKLRDAVSVLDFGADPTGATDATTAFQNALNSLGASGGVVEIGNGKYLIGSNLTINSNVTLKGNWLNPDLIGTSAVPTYQNAGSAIRLASTATINLATASGIEQILIYRSGMTFPVSGESSFAGTAITATGSNVTLRNLLVMGFNKLFYSTGNQRHYIDRVHGDNVNGIEVAASPDVDRISNCHMWPFACDTSIYPNAAVLRSGKAYYIHDIGDWAKLTNCFSYGYKTGYQISNANSCTMLSCSADSNIPVAVPGSIGFNITGTSTEVRLIACQAAAQEYGYVFNTGTARHAQVNGCNAWSNSLHNYLCSGSGDVTFTASATRESAYGVSIDNATSRVFINGMRFSAITDTSVFTAVATNKVFIGSNCDYGDSASGATITNTNATAQTVASADPLNLPPSGDTFTVSGTTNFGILNRGYPGRKVTLIFAGNLTVGHSTTGYSSMKLSGNVNFAATANSTLTLAHNGVQWYEIGRAT